MGSTYNLSATAKALMDNGTGIQSLMVGAVFTVYDGRQPVTADTDLSGNNVCATITLVNPPLGIYGRDAILVLDPLPAAQWVLATTPTFVRVTQDTTTVFDCSIGLASLVPDVGPDLVIKHSPVRVGDIAQFENGLIERLDGREVLVSA